jgi:hypothetical protein
MQVDNAFLYMTVAKVTILIYKMIEKSENVIDKNSKPVKIIKLKKLIFKIDLG